MRQFFLISLLLLVVVALEAQVVPVTWSGEFRLRTELDGRDMRNATAPNMFTLSRAR